MTEISLYIYPWDMLDDNWNSSYWRDLGVTDLSLAVSYHAGKFLQPGHSSRRVIFPEDGVVYLPVDHSRFGRLQPQASRYAERVAGLIAGRRDTDLSISGWTVVHHNSRLGDLHPGCCTQNVFGDRYPYALCPVHPDVSAYREALCQTMAGAGLSHLKLEAFGFMPYQHGYHHEVALRPIDRWLDVMLSLCFCPACQQAAETEAGLDMAVLRERLRRRIDAWLKLDCPADDALASQWLLNHLMTDSALRNFIDWRCVRVASGLRAVRRSLPADCRFSVISTVQQPQATSLFEGAQLTDIAATCDRVELPLYRSSVAEVMVDAHHALEQVGNPDSLGVILRPGYPDMTSESQLMETLAELKALGIRHFSFYNPGLLGARSLDWLSRALPLLAG